MIFGINTAHVYANDNAENPAFWTVFSGHVHGQVTKAIYTDEAVQVAFKSKFAESGNVNKRGMVVDLVNRMTASCIGQHIAGRSLEPSKSSFSVYNLLESGTASAVDSVIDADANTKLHDAFQAKNSADVIDVISRQTGRALFQACLHQLINSTVNPMKLASIVRDELLHVASGIVQDVL